MSSKTGYLIAFGVALVVLPSVMVANTHAAPGLWMLPVFALVAVTRIPRALMDWGAASLVAFGLAFYWSMHQATGGGSRSGAFGTAHWRKLGSGKGLEHWLRGRTTNPVGLVVGGMRGGKPVRSGWVVTADHHILVLGSPGTGKSTLIWLPSVGVIGDAGNGLLITDPKGELYDQAAGPLTLAHYDVVRFDLRDPAVSVRWNPLDAVTAALADGDLGRATQAARDLAQVLSAGAASENSQFFERSTTALLTALTLFVADRAPADARHLGTVYHTLISTKDLDAVFDALPEGHPAKQAYGPVRMSGAGETRQNQLTVAAAALSLWADPSMVSLTGSSELDLPRIAEGRVAIFVVVPDESSAFYGVAALFIQQVLQTLSKVAAERPGQKLARPFFALLDEFGNLPQLPDFDKVLAVGRGKGIRVVMALQAKDQLDARYGPQLANVMRNSCNTWVYLGSNDLDTARLVSEMAGQTTAQTTSRTSGGSGPEQRTISDTGKALITVDDLLRWPWGEALVLQRGELPARSPCRRFDEWNWAWGLAVAPTLHVSAAPPLWRPEPPTPAPPAASGLNILEPDGFFLEEDGGTE